MQNRHVPGTYLLLVVVLAAVAGCGNQEKPDSPQPPKVAGDLPGTGGLTEPGIGREAGGPPAEPIVEPAEPEPPPPPTIAEVHLTDQLRETCLVAVRDAMPAGQLPDTSGNPQPLTDLYGGELTVVLFWTVGDTPWAQVAVTKALKDLESDAAVPYAEKGLKVVSVNVHNTPEVAGECISGAEVTFPTLVDSDGAYFGLVATEKLPRVYLLDGEGKILWFDVEFSATTRRQLTEAIRAVLGDAAAEEEAGRPA